MNNVDLIIEKFEEKKFKEKKSSKKQGVFYTPWKIVNFIVSNAFIFFFENIYQNSKYSGIKLDWNILRNLIKDNKLFRNSLEREINGIKILDPASGSGRFLISAANYLLKIYGLLNGNQNEFLIKKKIIQEHLYGIDIDQDAIVISNLRLANWLYNGTNFLQSNKKITDLNLSKIKKDLIDLGITCNLFNEDFLLEFDHSDFNIIIGNPPYIENKKIVDLLFKNKIKKEFASAYKLFDLSVVFIEKSIQILNPKNGVLSFLTTNKFLASDYGIKIRKIILEDTKIRKIINISSLNAFKQLSTYPIIIFLTKGANMSNILSIHKFENYKEFDTNKRNQMYSFSQEKIRNFPSFTIPLSNNIKMIDKIYSKFDILSEVIKDLKLTYRPFSFIDWVQESKNIIKKNTSTNDMILIGTGNVNRYYIDFEKYIKVAKKRYLHPFFQYSDKYRNVWKHLSREKLIFREIAKNLSFIYDPGVFVNLTGLYFLQVPSYNTDQLFSLLTILNSAILNDLFKSLYGTLHMSSGYLRFNGSFIKNLPIPRKIPNCLSNLGRILQFLSQLKFELSRQPHFPLINEIKQKNINLLLEFYNNFVNNYVNRLYFQDYFIKSTKTKLPHFNFKFIISQYKYPNLDYYSFQEINIIFDDIYSFYNEYNKNGMPIN